jgi:hypothetical protein
MKGFPRHRAGGSLAWTRKRVGAKPAVAGGRGLTLLVLFLLLAGCAAPATVALQPTSPVDTAAPEPTSPRPADTPVPPPTTTRPTPVPTTTPLPPPGPAGSPPLVYQFGGDIWLYDRGAPRQLTSDGRSYQPQLSPHGRWVLFRRQEPPTELSASPFSLWVLDLASGQEQAIDLSPLPPYTATFEDGTLALPRWPLQTTWLPDGQSFLFNTMVDFSMLGPGSSPGDDLWLADAATGRVRSLFPGTGGYAMFTLSPDGQWVLWSRPTQIEAMRLSSGERRTLLEFPGVVTYSEYAWLPEPLWRSDSRSACVAIGPEDPMQSQAYTLWQLDVVEGSSRQLGQVQGAVFAWSPMGSSWSPDCSQLAYVTQVGQESRVVLAAADGSGAQELARGTNPMILGWSPDGRLALYQDESVLYGIAAGTQPQVRRLANVGWGVTVLWRDDVLLVAAGNGLLQVATDGSGVQNLQP